MNAADLDNLGRAKLATRSSIGTWEPLPEVALRQRCLELAIEALGRGNQSGALETAKQYYKYITGDSDANLHGQKQDER